MRAGHQPRLRRWRRVHALEAAAGEWILLVNDDAEATKPRAPSAWLLAERGRAAPSRGAASPPGRSASMRAPRQRSTPPAWSWTSCGVAYDRLAGAPAPPTAATSWRCSAPRHASRSTAARRCSTPSAASMRAFFAFSEDADVAWRARTARLERALYVPATVAYHHGSATAGEASAGKYYLVGRNRIPAAGPQRHAAASSLRWGWAMVLYDVAYVTFVVADRPHAGAAARPAGRPAPVARLPARRRALPAARHRWPRRPAHSVPGGSARRTAPSWPLGGLLRVVARAEAPAPDAPRAGDGAR